MIKQFTVTLKDIEAEIKDTGYWERQIGVVLIWVMPRPEYCDRGRWQFSAKSFDSTIITIDEQDGFPRYFFTEDALCNEITAWLRARKLIV